MLLSFHVKCVYHASAPPRVCVFFPRRIYLCICSFRFVFCEQTVELKDVETIEQYEFLLNEVEILKQLDHPNIAR